MRLEAGVNPFRVPHTWRGTPSVTRSRVEGRNAFQRPKKDAIKLLHDVMDIFAKA